MEDWREHERRFLASGDQDSLRRAIAGRRRAGLHVPLALLRGVVREARTLSSEIDIDVRVELLDGRFSELGRLRAGSSMRAPAHRMIDLEPSGSSTLDELETFFLEPRRASGLALRREGVQPFGFEKLRALERLLFVNGHFARENVSELRSVESLAELWCWGRSIEESALAALDELPALVSLSIGDDGNANLGALRASRLERLELRFARGDREVVSGFAELPALRELRLEAVHGFDGESVAALGRMTNLERLAVPFLVNGQTRELAKLSLRALEVQRLEDLHGLEEISRFERLEHLVVTHESAQLSELERLARLPLRTLVLSLGPRRRKGGRVGRELAKIRSLEELSLGSLGVDLEARDLVALTELPRLRALDLSGHRELSSTDFETIARVPALEKVDARHTRLERIGITALAQHATRLRELHLPDGLSDDDIAPLVEARELRVLGLAVPARAATAILEHVSRIPMLEQLVIRGIAPSVSLARPDVAVSLQIGREEPELFRKII